MKKFTDAGLRAGMILLGTALSAFSMGVFVLPYDILVPGVTGIGRLAELYFSADVTLVVGVCNAALLLLGLAVLGWRFAASIVIGSVAFPAFLGVFQGLTQLHALLDERFEHFFCFLLGNPLQRDTAKPHV